MNIADLEGSGNFPANQERGDVEDGDYALQETASFNNNNNNLDNADGSAVKPATTGRSIIFDSISDHAWHEVCELCKSSPSIASEIDPVSGRSPLHMVCSIGSVSPDVIEAVVNAAPDMITKVDKVYHDTPMHIICRNSQKRLSKAHIIFNHPIVTPEVMLQRNVIGGTCLHSACGHNAVLEVIQMIVTKNPQILKISTFDGIPPIRGLFFSYTQSIPGVIAVGKLLKGSVVEDGHVERFWKKASFLALEYYKLTTFCPLMHQNDENNNKSSDYTITDDKSNNNQKNSVPSAPAITEHYIAHGLIHYNAPLNLLKIAYKRNADASTSARAIDRYGNTPLHLLVERRPYRLKELDAIKATIEAAPEAASICNNDGHPPLMLAIRNKIPFENGMDEILKADMTVVSKRDSETDLLPFQLAATVGGPEALNTTFQLLSALPEVLNG